MPGWKKCKPCSDGIEGARTCLIDREVDAPLGFVVQKTLPALALVMLAPVKMDRPSRILSPCTSRSTTSTVSR
jgi:hypothetical protein